MTDTTATKALRIYADFVRKANLMASPAREQFLSGLAMQMDEAAGEFNAIDRKYEIRQSLKETGRYESGELIIH